MPNYPSEESMRLCVNCIYEDCLAEEEPCCKCFGNIEKPEYKSAIKQFKGD